MFYMVVENPFWKIIFLKKMTVKFVIKQGCLFDSPFFKMCRDAESS